MNFGIWRPRKHLTENMKIKLLSIISKRDVKFSCLQCKKPLEVTDYVNEHLLDDRRLNRPEDIAFCCRSCNNKKQHSPEMRAKALAKYDENLTRGNYMREKNYEEEILLDTPTEIEINQTNSEIVENYITEQVNIRGRIPFKDTLNSLVYKCKKHNNHGSQQAIRNYIDYLTSPVAPFEIFRDENAKKMIRRRQSKTNQNNVTDLQSSQSFEMNGGKENAD